ncbi:iron chelate uptake ABC transporter family permease subunit [Ancylobacter oerskovii]|nr:iron chelate uptake ABC transporter family permease subunit [Ancylobacter oerskovii]
MSAAVASGVGVIGFIGLASNALCNAIGVRTVRQRLIAAPAVGAALLGLTDLAVRHLALLDGVPTGAVTSLIGAPLLLLMIGRLPASRPGAGSIPQVSRLGP